SVLLNGNGSGTAQNYTFVTQTPTATVAAGASVTYDLTLAGRNGYNGTITFACTGLPAKAACSFSPASVVADGNLPLSTTLTISTAAATSRANSNTAAPLLIESLSGLGLFGLMLTGAGKKRGKGKMTILLGAMLLVMMFTLVGCGGTSTGGSSGTPAGSYT